MLKTFYCYVLKHEFLSVFLSVCVCSASYAQNIFVMLEHCINYENEQCNHIHTCILCTNIFSINLLIHETSARNAVMHMKYDRCYKHLSWENNIVGLWLSWTDIWTGERTAAEVEEGNKKVGSWQRQCVWGNCQQLQTMSGDDATSTRTVHVWGRLSARRVNHPKTTALL